MGRTRNRRNQDLTVLALFLLGFSAWAGPTKTVPRPGTAETQPFPPPPELPAASNDNKKKSDAAKALGIVGAVLAGVSCAMSLAEGKISEGLSQCAQAAQSAAGAAKNDDRGKQVTAGDRTLPSLLPTSGLGMEAADEVSDGQAREGSGEPAAVETGSAPVDVAEAAEGEKTRGSAEVEPESTRLAVEKHTAESPKGGSHTLRIIMEDSPTSDVNQRPAVAMIPSSAATQAGLGFSALTAGDFERLTRGVPESDSRKSKRGFPSQDTPDHSPTISEQPTHGASSTDWESRLAGLLGRGSHATGDHGSSGGREILFFPSQADLGEPPNIFEYAAWRLRRHASHEARNRSGSGMEGA